MASVSIADLTISITDNSKQAANEVMNLADACVKLRNASSNTGLKQVANEAERLKSSSSGVTDRLKASIASITAPAQKAASALDRVNKAYDNITKGSKATLDKIDFSKISNAIQSVGKFGSNVFNNILPSGISRTISQFMRLAKMRIMRTIIKNLLAGFTEGLQNCYYWAKATGDQFANSMDTITTSLNYAKNSIGAVFSNVLNAVAPVIDSLIDVLVQGINYINMFFAVLRGESSYTKAKKVAVEYGKAVQGAAGGAAGAVKELKEELSVLDFDELHQLQEAATPSGGGGGGGGGGGSATNYADMFEKAAIEDNWLTRTAGWLKDNFDDILPIIEAIGAGILAWKISTAFANSIGSLFNLKDTFAMGLTIMVTGAVLEYKGAESIGKNGINWMNLLETLLGAGGVIGGGALAFGAGSLVFTIPLAIGLAVSGYIAGVKAKYKEELQNNPEYQRALKELEESVSAHKAYTDIMVEVRNIELKYRQNMGKADAAQNIIDKIKQFDGLEVTPDVDLTALQNLVDQFNALGFDDIIASWDVVNGKIETNVDDLQAAIDKFKEYARVTALEDLYVQLDVATAEQNVAVGERDYAQWEYDQILAQIREKYPNLLANMNNEYGNGAGWQPGEDPYNEIDLKPENKEALEMLAIAETWYEKIGELDAVIGDKDGVVSHIQALIDEILGLGNASEYTAGKINPSDVLSQNKPYSSIYQYDWGGRNFAEQNRVTPTGDQPQLNIFADATKNANYAGTLTTATKNLTTAIDGNIRAERNHEQQTHDTNIELKEFNGQLYDIQQQGGGSMRWLQEKASYSVKDFGNVAEKSSGQVSQIGDAVVAVGRTNVGGMFTNLNRSIVNQNWGSTGLKVQGQIAKPINEVPNAVNYSTITGNINTGLGNATKSTNFAANGAVIGGAIQTAASSSYNAWSVVSGYSTGMSNSVSKASFPTIGKKVGADVQSGAYNGFSSDTLIKAYNTGMSAKAKSTNFKGIGSIMSASVQQGMTDGLSSKSIMSALYNGMMDAAKRSPFINIGRQIGVDIKRGIYEAVQKIDFSTVASANGVKKYVTGTAWTSMAFASGGYPQTGDLFLANEAGAEMVGTIGGRTAVANNDQIASAIARALQPMLSSGGNGTQTTNVEVKLDSATIAKASMKGQKAMNRQFNIQARA